MVTALFDTNILIDYLSGIHAAKNELDQYSVRSISAITWMEVLVGTPLGEEASVRAWLATFTILPVDNIVANRAVEIRRQTRVRLPDAIIWATAQVHSMLLVSRNTKDFPADAPGIRMPYKL